MMTARMANKVLAHLYVIVANIWLVNNGNAIAIMFPDIAPENVNGEAGGANVRLDSRQRLCPANADDANGP